MKHCINCKTLLSGRQRKFCSRKCKNAHNNDHYQSYQAQQKRGRERKLQLIEMKGMECERCGYNKNYAALEFHHPAPEDKEFQLDIRSLSNRRWAAILREVKSCRLLCSNCHAEEHNPQCMFPAGFRKSGLKKP